jgi:hypothetical protein
MENLNDKLNTYETLHSYFANYVFEYMEHCYDVTSWNDIDNWSLTKNKLVINYYDEYVDDVVELCLDTSKFFEFIKNKE